MHHIVIFLLLVWGKLKYQTVKIFLKFVKDKIMTWDALTHRYSFGINLKS